MQRWVSAFETTLEASPEILTPLLGNIHDDLDAQSQEALEAALREVCLSCLSRIIRETHPYLGDKAEALLDASTVPEMNAAAQDLRQAALGVRRLLMGAQVAETCSELAASIPELGQRRLELANLAADVVTAVDRLQRLVPDPYTADLRQATEAGSDLGHTPPDDEGLYRLYQRQLEARHTVVRLGTRLLLGLGLRSSGTRGSPTLPDLLPVLEVAAGELPDPGQVGSIAAVSLPRHVRPPNGICTSREYWGSVFKAALVESPATLALLLDNIEDSLGARGIRDLIAALRKVLLACLSRIIRETHPDLGDKAEPLLDASTVPEMNAAAQDLRRTSLGVRGLLMHPLLVENYIALAPAVQDPEGRCLELADLAVDVITSVDQLQRLLSAPHTADPGLATEAGSDHVRTPPDDEALDRLIHRRLDARRAAVHLATRLLGELRSDVGYL
jgi:hypothetical protein